MVQTKNEIIYPTSLAEFQDWEVVDGFKYEWNDGEVIKFDRMNRKHLKLIRLLLHLFNKTKAYQNGGTLIPEQDVLLSGIQLRRPDLAFFNNEQIENALNEEPIPAFTIEVISTNDQIIPVKNKLKEYFKHGVKVVWLIYPDDKLVEVYTSYKNIQVCSDGDICSAKPVLPDFEIAAANLFE